MQPPEFYNNVSEYEYWFAGYVANGGILEMHISPYDQWFGYLVFGLHYCYDYEPANVTLTDDEEHPLLNSPNIICDYELTTSGYFDVWQCYEDQYINIIAWNTHNNMPTWVEFSWGSGAVIATTIPMEWLYTIYNETDGEYGSPVLENIVAYPDEEDISIKVTPYKEIFARGFPITMNITAINRGDIPLIFTIEIYLDLFYPEGWEEKISIINITTWLTFLSSYKYTLEISDPNLLNLIDNGFFLVINVEPKPYETNEKNCIFMAINPVIPGDTNSDGQVNILDAALLALAFSSISGGPNWNPNADVNGDNKVNILDCIILANHFGQNWNY